MNAGRPAWAGLLFALVAACPARAQSPFGLPGLGGDESAVRLADDPRQNVERERRALVERQQGLVLHAQDADEWRRQQKLLRARKSELLALRRVLVRSTMPTEAEREWHEETAGDRIVPVTPPDAGLPDAGSPDAGQPDVGTNDAGPTEARPATRSADAAVFADSADSADSADAGLSSPDAAPPDTTPPPPVSSTARLLPLIEHEGGFLAPRVHPAQLDQLDAVLSALDAVHAALGTPLRLHGEERAHLTQSLARADAVLKLIEDTRSTTNPDADRPGLRQLERIALDAHLARIELSLARARQRQAQQDASGTDTTALPTQAPTAMLESGDLQPWAAFAESFALAEGLREEHVRLRQQARDLGPTIGALRAATGRTADRRHRLDLIYAEQLLSYREADLDRALDRMAITSEEMEWAEEKHQRSIELRQKAIPKLEAQLDALRIDASTLGATDASAFSDAKVNEVQRMMISEKVVFERLKLERDVFRAELARALIGILRGLPPTPDFVERFASILDRNEITGRQNDLQTRCDGWRRAQNETRRDSVPESLAANREALSKGYDSLADVCMREEWVLATQLRLGDIARYQLDKYAWRARGFGWYAWRSVVTVLLLFLALLMSRWLGRLSRRIADRGELGDRVEGDVLVSGEFGAVSSAETSTAPVGHLRAFWRRRVGSLRNGLGLVTYLGGGLLIWCGAAFVDARYLWEVPIELQRVLSWVEHPLFIVADREVSLWSLFSVALWAVAAIWVGRILQRFISDLLERFSVERGVRDTIGTIARYVVILAGVAIGFSSAGIGLGALAVVFGVIGIGIGFGLQNIANNFISGFIILLERPIRKGDFVQVGDMIGEVKEISARATTIETRDAVSVIVPNAEFVSGRVINWTLGHLERVRCQVHVGVAYGSDVDLVERTLLSVARSTDGVLRNPRPAVEMSRFGDSSLDFMLHVWTERIRTLPALVSSLNRGVDRAFRQNSIQIPFPQRDIHIRTTVERDDRSAADAIGRQRARMKGE